MAAAALVYWMSTHHLSGLWFSITSSMTPFPMHVLPATLRQTELTVPILVPHWVLDMILQWLLETYVQILILSLPT